MRETELQIAIDQWIAQDPDPETRKELQSLVAAGDQVELADRFAARLEFGTAGLRGVVGAGPRRMNRLVVRQTTYGLASYLQACFEDARERGVVVGCDARHFSDEFTEEACNALQRLGFTVHRFERPTATPLVAYAVPATGAVAGIMITASHNPPEYNGFKVFWENGAQIIPPHDGGIAAAIATIASTGAMPDATDREGVEHRIGDALDQAYLDAVFAHLGPATGPGCDKKDLKIAYSAMHGVGGRFIERVFQRDGFAHLFPVESQHQPDGSFPTVRFPNPEEPGALDALIACAEQNDAPLALASDPDADRLAVVVRAADQTYHTLNGDQIGALLADACLRATPDASKAALGTTIVSSRMLGALATHAGAHGYVTLTGFKWIANHAMELEKTGLAFAFGYEEAIGYTIGPVVRDKDGISAALAFARLAQGLHAEGRDVLDALDDLYARTGVYLTQQRSLPLGAGVSADALGDRLRATPPTSIGGRRVVHCVDLARSREGRSEQHSPDTAQYAALPSANVLIYLLDDNSRVIVRPSGTEPKIKCYYEVIEAVADRATVGASRAAAQRRLDALVESHQRDLATA